MAVLPEGPGRARTCNSPVKSRELCQLELRSHDVAGRNRTCGALRFRQALYRAELRPQSRRGWDRTSDLLFVRQALVPTELLAEDPGQGIEPRPPGSEPGILPVRRSRSVCGRAPQRQGARRRLSVHATCVESTQSRASMSRLARAETMFSKPLALLFDPGSTRPALREPSCRPSWRSFGARCVRILQKRHW